MKCKIINDYNLKDNEIDGTVIRVKAFIINSKNEILVASSNGGAQLIGGHVEVGEKHSNSLKREILEEAGIDVELEEISEPFYEIKHYCKNYFGTGKNKIAEIFYYIVNTDKTPNITKTNLTKQEEKYKFNVEYVHYDNFENYISGFLNSEKEANRWIAKEMIEAFKELEEYKITFHFR